MVNEVYEFGEYRLIRSARELWCGASRVNLPRHTYECLDFLISRRDRAVHRDELATAVLRRSNVSDSQLGQIILRSRRAVGDDGNAQRMIRTVVGFGFRWIAETQRVDLDEARSGGSPEVAPQSPSIVDSTERLPAASEQGAALGMAHRNQGASRRLVKRVLAAAVLAAAVAGMAVLIYPKVSFSPPPRVQAPSSSPIAVVLPVKVDGHTEDAWMRLGAMDLIADRLREAGVRIPSTENVLTVLSTTQEGDSDDRLRQVTGADLLIRAVAVRDDSGWRVELLATPSDRFVLPATFADPDALTAVRGATDLMLAALGHDLPVEGAGLDAVDQAVLRARAALLANEIETARAIIINSPALSADPLQFTFRMAQVDNQAGRYAEAEAALSAVLDQGGVIADARLHSQLLSTRGVSRVLRGEFEAAGRDYDGALKALGDRALPGARGTALGGRAIAHAIAGRHDQALADFLSARFELESAGDQISVASIDSNLGILEFHRDHPAAAIGYLSSASSRLQSLGALSQWYTTLSGLAKAHLMLMDRAAALAVIEPAWQLRDRLADPDQRLDLLLNRVEILLGLGRYHEARTALNAADTLTRSKNWVLLARQGRLQADLALRQGEWERAAAEAARALDVWPDAVAEGDRAAVILLRQRALLGAGRAGEARALLDRSRPVPAEPTLERGAVFAAIAMAEWAVSENDPVRSRQWLDYAAASAERRNLPLEIVAVAVAYASQLPREDARSQAAAVVARVAPWAMQDFDCALAQVRLFQVMQRREPWSRALRQAEALRGEREIPAALRVFEPPSETAGTDAI